MHSFSNKEAFLLKKREFPHIGCLELYYCNPSLPSPFPSSSWAGFDDPSPTASSSSGASKKKSSSSRSAAAAESNLINFDQEDSLKSTAEMMENARKKKEEHMGRKMGFKRGSSRVALAD